MSKVPAVIKELEEYMFENQFTQTDMANYLGIAVTQLNRWIATKRMSKSWVELLKAKKIINESHKHK